VKALQKKTCVVLEVFVSGCRNDVTDKLRETMCLWWEWGIACRLSIVAASSWLQRPQNGNFYSMVETIRIFEYEYFLRDEGGTTRQVLVNYTTTSGRFPTRLHNWAVAGTGYLGSVNVNTGP
jgi:hypothetical protein